MAAFVVGFVLFLAMAGHSDATYCVCNTGQSDSVLQKNIDYACGAGADCSAILQNGACFNPNTVRDHCNYAVNSYYQRKGQISGSCDFMGTATVTQTAPSAATGCVYQSSPSLCSNGGSTSPTTNSTGGTPNTGGGSGTLPGSNVSPNIGLGPTGSGFDNNSASVTSLSQNNTFMMLIMSFFLSLLISGSIRPRM
ncbi:hypothetical protein DH2020_049886 [Rehmannia glutinosa]|uniref:X8 domain-containing protein n=1 Tax=Rehmannia glutinosa TaxID=99300 RepID=A0ABR0U1Q6_REHGL